MGSELKIYVRVQISTENNSGKKNKRFLSKCCSPSIVAVVHMDHSCRKRFIVLLFSLGDSATTNKSFSSSLPLCINPSGHGSGAKPRGVISPEASSEGICSTTLLLCTRQWGNVASLLIEWHLECLIHTIQFSWMKWTSSLCCFLARWHGTFLKIVDIRRARWLDRCTESTGS